jgi:hypothetical protein
MKFGQISAILTIALCLSASTALSDSTWLSTVSDGYYNDTNNWSGGIQPTNAAVGYFTGNQDYTIGFPAGGLTENSVTRVGRLSNGRSLTFDTTGTWWLKSGPDAWPNSWTGFQMQDYAGRHQFNIEGVIDPPDSANAYPIMLMSNALFRLDSYTAVITNTLDQGLLNLYDPGGVKYSDHTLITGASTAQSIIIFKSGSHFRANNVRLRGNGKPHLMRFEGGDHEIYNGLQIGEGASNAGYTNIVEVTGGQLSLPAGTLYIGGGKAGSYGELSISDAGAVNTESLIMMSSPYSGSSASLQLSGTGSLSAGAYIDIAYTSSSTATVSIAENASISATSNLAIARGNNSVATMEMTDQATGYAGGYLLIGGYSGSDGTLSIQDNATLTVNGDCTVGADSGTGRLELHGGQLTARKFTGDASAQSEFYANGGTLIADNISASVNLLEDFDLAELGNAGLTVDSAGYDIVIDQNFSDADSSEGLFIKKGAGTLSASSSTHARTLIAEDQLLLTDSAAQFGRSIVVTNGASISMEGTAATLTAGDLTLGTSTDMAYLYMDATDSITVTNSNGLTVNKCGIYFGGTAANGIYTLFRSTDATISSAAVNNLILLNPTAAKDYSFAIVTDGSDSTIQLTVSNLTIQNTVWDGSESTDWNTADNWSSAVVPVNGTYASFNASATEKTVNISSPAECTYLTFNSSSPYTIQGESLSVSGGGVSNVVGLHTLSMPLTLLGNFSAQTALATTTTVSGAITSYQSNWITKSGSGSLIVSGNNDGFGGKWSTSAGRLEFAAPSALGSANEDSDAITVGAGTLTYSGSTPTPVEKGITTDPVISTNAAIFETLGDLTVNGTFTAHSGIICKRGTGDLTLDIGNSTATLSASNGSGGSNVTPAGTIAFPESGDSPVTPTGLGGFNVVEGTMRLKGNGPTVSIVNQLHVGIVGGKSTSCLAAPTLELDNIRMNQGDSGLHFIIGNQITAASVATNPTLRLINNAIFRPNMIRMGYGVDIECSPTLIMSNSTANINWQLDIGNNDKTYPIVRLREGSYLNAEAGNQWGGGIYVYRNVDVIVSENSILSQNNPGGSFRLRDSFASGTMRFESGGTMRFAQFQGRNTYTTEGLDVIFDDGVMEPIASGFSYSTKADKQSFIIEAGGLTVNTPSGISHALTFPITGVGDLTKTGAGELIFAEGVTFTSTSATNYLGYPSTLTGIATGSYTGSTVVAEGTLTVSNGTIRTDAVVAIESGATLNLSDSSVTLEEISGTGTIASGTLTEAYRCNVSATGNDNLAFEDITLPAGVYVMFDPANGYSLTNNQTLAIATRTGTTALNLESWKSSEIGNKMTATFTLESDTVYANISYVGGTVIIIR